MAGNVPYGWKTYAGEVEHCQVMLEVLAGRFANYGQGPEYTDFGDYPTRSAVKHVLGLLEVAYQLLWQADDKRGGPVTLKDED